MEVLDDHSESCFFKDSGTRETSLDQEGEEPWNEEGKPERFLNHGIIDIGAG